MRTLIGGVGYAWQGDLAFGLAVIETLQHSSWPTGVEVADLSHNPIAVFQQIRTLHYDRLILLGAVQRGHAPGLLRIYRPIDPLPHTDEIQARIVESGSGIISLDNIIIISRFYGAMPVDTQIIEVEPVDDLWGHDLSPVVRAIVGEVVALITDRVSRVSAAP